MQFDPNKQLNEIERVKLNNKIRAQKQYKETGVVVSFKNRSQTRGFLWAVNLFVWSYLFFHIALNQLSQVFFDPIFVSLSFYELIKIFLIASSSLFFSWRINRVTKLKTRNFLSALFLALVLSYWYLILK